MIRSGQPTPFLPLLLHLLPVLFTVVCYRSDWCGMLAVWIVSATIINRRKNIQRRRRREMKIKAPAMGPRTRRISIDFLRAVVLCNQSWLSNEKNLIGHLKHDSEATFMLENGILGPSSNWQNAIYRNPHLNVSDKPTWRQRRSIQASCWKLLSNTCNQMMSLNSAKCP